ncbi:hypothetical protein DXG01_017105 [Tephrocybe rancida]|nr:hypothetical protein DXG01_017105 [Tephrocybe rancida]
MYRAEAYKFDEAFLQKCSAVAQQSNENAFFEADWAMASAVKSTLQFETQNLYDTLVEVSTVRDVSESDTIDLNERISALSHDIDTNITRLSSLRLTFAHIKRLPNELLARLFVFAQGGLSVSIPPISQHLPYTLLQVCSRWRTVALNESALWRRAYISIPNTHPDLSLLKCVEERIFPKNGPLEMTVDSPACDDITPLIAPYLPRLTRLHLDTRGISFLYLLTIPHDSFSMIEDFGLYLDIEDEDKYCYLDRLTVNMQRLTKFTLDITCRTEIAARRPHSILFYCIPHIRWEMLTYLHLGQSTCQFVLDKEHLYGILRQCIVLEYLSYGITKSGLQSDFEMLSLPRLQSLYIRHEKFLLFAPLLRLTSLIFEGSQYRLDSAGLLRSFSQTPHLESLTINGPMVCLYNRTTSIALPSLHTISLTGGDVEILNSFTTPNLTHLSITQSAFDSLLRNIKRLDPTQHILSLVQRSHCALLSLKVQFRSPETKYRWQNRSGLLELFTALPDLGTLDMGMVMPDDIIEKIGEGSLLPSLWRLHGTVESPSGFARMLERRVRCDGCERIRSARGLYYDQDGEIGTSEARKQEERVGRLANVYNVSVSLRRI